MKKFLLLFLVAFLVAGNAFALSCKVSQDVDGSDECWTKVTLSSSETTLVSIGDVLVYDVSATSPNQGDSQVIQADASVDNVIVAGVAQGSIVSGEDAMILVRGHGVVQLVSGVATGGALYASATEGSAGPVASTGPQLGFALETATDGTTSIEAYITVV